MLVDRLELEGAALSTETAPARRAIGRHHIAAPPHERLAFIGRKLYGRDYSASLATFLRINRRTMQRMLKGAHAIPEPVWIEIADACRAKAREMQRLAGEIGK